MHICQTVAKINFSEVYYVLTYRPISDYWHTVWHQWTTGTIWTELKA